MTTTLREYEEKSSKLRTVVTKIGYKGVWAKEEAIEDVKWTNKKSLSKSQDESNVKYSFGDKGRLEQGVLK